MARVQMPRKQVDQLDELVNDQVNTGYIAQQLNLSYSTVKRVLRTLKQRDMIYRVGSDKSGYWRIKEE